MSFVTIYVNPNISCPPTVLHRFILPEVTTVHYAALWMAEEMGIDEDELHYWLVDALTLQVVPDNDLLAGYDGMTFGLGWGPREETT